MNKRILLLATLILSGCENLEDQVRQNLHRNWIITNIQTVGLRDLRPGKSPGYICGVIDTELKTGGRSGFTEFFTRENHELNFADGRDLGEIPNFPVRHYARADYQRECSGKI
jgi:hypothetical protein